MFTIGAFAIILDNQKKVLFCHRRDYDLWNLPGGRVESGESPWEAVIREVKEETGLDVEVKRLVGIYTKPKEDDVVFSFLCDVIGGKITLNDEADHIEYFAFDDIPKNSVPKQVERIRDALSNKRKLIMKAQFGKRVIDLIKEGKL
ncbi:MAG: NUDIX domain-containing protein [Patescibacteria group bacterium]|nr:NUDIX domain-containing protein [Patescibacteria group bacterium]